MRERGNQYQAHLAEVVPNVLSFEAEPCHAWRQVGAAGQLYTGPHRPAADIEIDQRKRPFVVVDPRAGHGPGIGGFKAESEIGAALQAGHPSYIVGFTPDPMPSQTVEDVMRAVDAAHLIPWMLPNMTTRAGHIRTMYTAPRTF
jgi:Protein of unknown function (DUF3141)